MKKQERKGITLIALVITIIVLLILAGITVNLIIGDNGIFVHADRARKEQVIAEDKEVIQLSYMSLNFDKKIKGADITAENLSNEINKSKKATVLEVSSIPENGIVVIDETKDGKIFEIAIGDNKYYVEVAGGEEKEEWPDIPVEVNKYFEFEIIGENEARLTGMKGESYEDSNGYHWTIDEEEIMLTEDTLTIPGYVYVENENGELVICKVTEIGNNAFYQRVFDNKEIIFPETLKVIGNDISGINENTKIYIPSSVNEIGEDAFMDFGRLTINIQKKENTIKGEPWGANWPKIKWASYDTSFTITQNNINIIGIEIGEEGELIIPETFEYNGIKHTVVGLADYAIHSYIFDWEYYEITSIVLPNTVRNIGKYALENCYYLTSITFGGVKYTDKTTFNQYLIAQGIASEDVWY